MQQADRHGVGIADSRDEVRDFRIQQRLEHRAIVQGPLGHSEFLAVRHQAAARRRSPIVEIRPILAGQLEDVLESVRRDEGGAGAEPLEQGVRGHRRTVNHLGRGKRTDAFEDGEGRIVGGRPNLGAAQAPPVPRDEVSERAAAVNPDTHLRSRAVGTAPVGSTSQCNRRVRRASPLGYRLPPQDLCEA